MAQISLRQRYRRIITFFAGIVLQLIFWDILLPALGLRFWSRKTRSQRYQRIAARFRQLALRMGGLMIKVGQFLSTRLDVLPPEITRELAGLQDEVPPESFADIRLIAETELGAPLSELFAAFDESPLAAASLGQVHRARLDVPGPTQPEFTEVVVKIQRPHIAELVEVDLSALRRVGGWLKRYRPISRRVNVEALVNEFATTTYQEIDYLAEGSHAETFQAQFKQNPKVHVPRVVWNLTTKRTLTLEDVYAIKITDYDAITQAGIDRGEVARLLLATYLQQIFEDGFFHADPHPGNLFITPRLSSSQDTEAPAWQLTFVDFGMVGQVPENLRQGLRELVIAVGTRDASRVVRAYQLLGVLLPGADIKLIEQAEAQMFDRFWGKSMSELGQFSHAEMHQFAHQFSELMYSMPFQLPHNLLLLGRCVAILSGMCTGLDANFNLWEQLAPYARRLVSEEGDSGWKFWLDEVGKLLKGVLALPSQSGRVLALIERGDLQVQMPQISRQITHIETALYRLIGSLFIALFLGFGILMINASETRLAVILFALSFISLLWTIFLARGHNPHG
jgi:predicted unusual protein kinase regulating ubiquinone biosynthesis (AarF/ABC1/UbiB family)